MSQDSEDFKSIIERGYNHVNQAIRTSNTFPINASFNIFKTFTDFNIVTSKIRDNVIQMYSQVLSLELPSATIRRENNEDNMDRVVEANDSTLENIQQYIDSFSGESRPAAAQPAAWNRAPVLATVKVQGAGGEASLIAAKNIPRPQLAFKDAVDNSDSIFVPRLPYKPNAVRPLEPTLIYDEFGRAIEYEHPYLTELQMYSPPAWALAEREPPPPPPPLEATPLTMVESPPQLDALLAHLRLAPEIAVDLEHHAYRTYQGITCLIQITTEAGGDFIVDALALREHLHLLNETFTDPNKVKVFHGADSDVLWLQRDFGVYLVGLFDTHQAARLLALGVHSLKFLLNRYCGVQLDKMYQLADWRIRPLPAELVRYARSDTHYLLTVWRLMAAELRTRDPPLLLTAFQHSSHVAAMTYKKPDAGPAAHMGAYRQSGKRFGRAQMAALGALWAWRDQHARAADESPAFLLPNHMLMALAEALPRDLQGLRALAHPAPPFFNQNIHHVHSIILACREVPDQPTVLSMPANIASLAAPRYVHHATLDLEADGASASSYSCSEYACGVPPPELVAFLPPTPPASPPQPEYMPPPQPEYMPPPQPAHLPPLRPHPAPYQYAVPGQPVLFSQLNAKAAAFVPPYERYKMYRVLLQAEEIKALEKMEAKVSVLGHDDAVRGAVMSALQPATATAAAGSSAGRAASPPVHIYAKPVKSEAPLPAQAAESSPAKRQDANETAKRRRKRGANHATRDGGETSATSRDGGETSATSRDGGETSATSRDGGEAAAANPKGGGSTAPRPFDYRRADYTAFHNEKASQRHKRPKKK